MRYLVLVPDGCADEPLEQLDGKTPLQAAAMPNLARWAESAEIGRAAVIPQGMPPGSDVGNMSILGYDPAEFHTGRAPIEAAAMGIVPAPDEVVFRCNLVTVSDDGIMVDFAGGHPSSEQAHPIIEALRAELGGDGIAFHPGVEYRHLLVVPGEWGDAECVPPHDLSDKVVALPSGPAADKLRGLMDASRPIVSRVAEETGSIANQIWLWGQGVRPTLPSFARHHGVQGRMTSAVDLVRGLGALTDMDVVDVPGASAGFENDYAAQRDAALESLRDRPFFLLHVEATDEAGHQGNVEEKVRSLERWDSEIIGPIIDTLEPPYRVLLLPDHATPCALKTHTSDPVPYLLYDSEIAGKGGTYDEAGVATAPVVAGHELMARLVANGAD